MKVRVSWPNGEVKVLSVEEYSKLSEAEVARTRAELVYTLAEAHPEKARRQARG